MMTAGRRSRVAHRRHRSSSSSPSSCTSSPSRSSRQRATPGRRRHGDAGRRSPAALVLSWSLMLSQAMESVTRAFYARSDLDLILSSPVSARRVFAVRIGPHAGLVVVMAVLLAAPFINMLAYRAAAALACRLWRGRRDRRVARRRRGRAHRRAVSQHRAKAHAADAQVVAAIIGAAFVIGLQVAAILSYGTLSRARAAIATCGARARARSSSVVWWPARAVLGDLTRARRRARRQRRCCSPRRSSSSPAASATTPSPPPASPATAVRQRRGSGFRRGSPAPRCAGRNGRCSAAIPGSLRRR